jgi:hypothetical protein
MSGRDDDAGERRSGAARALHTLLRPVWVCAAILYFLFDAIFVGLLAPLVSRIARAPIFRPLTAWILGLPPWPTLILFLVPIIALEPAKPVGAYLVATGRPGLGILVLVLAEITKITVVERLYHLSRDKLLTIPIFARVHDIVVRVLAAIRAIPAVAATLAALARLREVVRRFWHGLRHAA